MPKLSKADKRAKISATEARRRKEIAPARIREMEADEKASKLSGARGFSYRANNSWPPGQAAAGAVRVRTRQFGRYPLHPGFDGRMVNQADPAAAQTATGS